MGCACNSNRNTQAKQRNVAVPRVVNIPAPQPLNPAEKAIQEKRITEMRRRENILKALKRP